MAGRDFPGKNLCSIASLMIVLRSYGGHGGAPEKSDKSN